MKTNELEKRIEQKAFKCLSCENKFSNPLMYVNYVSKVFIFCPTCMGENLKFIIDESHNYGIDEDCVICGRKKNLVPDFFLCYQDFKTQKSWKYLICVPCYHDKIALY